MSVSFSSLAAGPRQESVQLPQKHEVEVRLVLADVIATKGGKFFPGLGKEDFELLVDGAEVRINSCDLISLGTSGLPAAPGNEPKVPVIERKKRLAVLFDGINAGDREFRKAAQQISDELVSFSKNDVDVMVLFLDNEQGLRIVQPFTDRASLIREAAGKAAGSAFSQWAEVLDYSDKLVMANAMAEESKRWGLASPDLGEIYEVRAIEHTNTAAAKLTRTISGILASLVMLESLPGRKNLLLVSGGLPDMDTFRLADRRVSLDDQIPFAGTISVFDPFGILGKTIFRTGDEIVTELVRVANDRNISIYSLDPAVFARNVPAGTNAESFDRLPAETLNAVEAERSRQLQNLRAISEKTGAALLRGANKIENLRETVGSELSSYYLLSFYPPKTRVPGEHKIEIRVKGTSGIRVRARDGYSDFPPEAAKRLLLARAFYDPQPFLGRLPFRAELVPLALDEGKPRSWLNIALPGGEFFRDRFAGRGQKSFEFHFWIKGGTERVLAGNISVPLDMEAARKRLAPLDYYRLHFAGPGLGPSESGGQVIFALFDPESGEIGTWVSDAPPALGRDGKTASFVNCTFVQASPRAGGASGTLSLDDRDGSLGFGPWTIFPKVAGPFSLTAPAFIFCQIYNPLGSRLEIELDFKDRNGTACPVEVAKAAENWNPKTKIWSGILKLDFKGAEAGDYLLKIEVPMPATAARLIREMRLTLM